MKLKADKVSVRKLLGQNGQQFRIPPYQRPYAWGDEQVDALWQDILDSVGSNHFLGSLVVASEDDDRPQVIDGQQRLTTLMILLSVVREALHVRGLNRNVQKLDTLFTADAFATGDAYFKFRTGNANWPIFRDFIMRGPTDPNRKSQSDVGTLDPDLRARNAPLLSNWARLRAAVETELEPLSSDRQIERLASLQKALLEGVELVHIEVDDLSDAFMLFETLNDRGLQLSAADLLKNHLLGEIAKTAGMEDVDTAAASWDDMLEELGPGVDVSRFLRHYLLVRIPKVRKDDIFGHFKSRIKQDGPNSVLAELRLSAKSYGDFECPQRVVDPAARAVLLDLQTLRATTCYISLLPARRHLSADDFVAFARLAEVLTYRYSSIVGLGTNELERRYHLAARILQESKGTKLAEARDLLIATMPDSEQFRVAFERQTMGKQYLLKYTLQKIEAALSDSREKVVDVGSLVHIEHIMPRKLTPAWTTALGSSVAFHSEYLNRWGNLTLIDSRLNIPASNKSFEQKLSYYQKSAVRITNGLTSNSSWGIKAIEERQAWLGERADEVWAVPLKSNASALATTHVPEDDALAVFATTLGELFPAVEPRCLEASPDEIHEMSFRASGYLADHGYHRSTAEVISQTIMTLVEDWDRLDGAQRAVLVGAVDYYLDPDDEIADSGVDGLEDDRNVVLAACVALGRNDLAAALAPSPEL